MYNVELFSHQCRFDSATANLLTMQMNMMQNMMAQMENNYPANQFIIPEGANHKYNLINIWIILCVLLCLILHTSHS